MCVVGSISLVRNGLLSLRQTGEHDLLARLVLTGSWATLELCLEKVTQKPLVPCALRMYEAIAVSEEDPRNRCSSRGYWAFKLQTTTSVYTRSSPWTASPQSDGEGAQRSDSARRSHSEVSVPGGACNF